MAGLTARREDRRRSSGSEELAARVEVRRKPDRAQEGLFRRLCPRLLLRGEGGQALIEFTLLLVPLLLILFGALEFGRAWNNKNDAVHLANEVARMAAVGHVDCAVLASEVSNDGLTLSQPLSWTGGVIGAPVTATVHVQFTSFVGGFVPGLPSALTGTATMRIEQDVNAGTC